MRVKDEEGQAIVLVALAMSIFLLGAVGLAVDGSHLYSQRQMAQTAADAAAIAGMMSVFDGTNGAGTAAFTATQGTSFTCTSKPSSTPCQYASKDGFALSSDTVTVSFPADSAAPGVSFSSDATHLIQVTVQRSVNTTLLRFLGPTATTVQAVAMAAIVDVVAPVPILVTHPTMSGALSSNGGVDIIICGGPSRSIQVNSSDPNATSTSGKGTVDLSKAGPPDPGDCSTGTGADFGVWGGPSSSTFVYKPGTTGHYVQPASPILDPLAGVSPPTDPGFNGTQTSGIAGGTDGCPSGQTCTLYSPGDYPNGIDGKLQNVLFKPGIYYVQNGFTCSANCNLYMATGFTDTGAGTTGTGWTNGMLVYNTGTITGTGKKAVSTYAPVNLGANGTISLVGSPSSSTYLGMLFFEDRSAPVLSHSLGGGGAMTLQGTIYLNNTLALMSAGTGPQYQALSLSGGSGSGTLIEGEIITGALSLGGNSSIQMNLNSNSVLQIRQVALVN